jgi:hypothetical protein
MPRCCCLGQSWRRVSATFALKAGPCVRRVRFVILAPDPRRLRRCQAGNPLIGLSEFPEPSLPRVAGRCGQGLHQRLPAAAAAAHERSGVTAEMAAGARLSTAFAIISLFATYEGEQFEHGCTTPGLIYQYLSQQYNRFEFNITSKYKPCWRRFFPVLPLLWALMRFIGIRRRNVLIELIFAWIHEEFFNLMLWQLLRLPKKISLYAGLATFPEEVRPGYRQIRAEAGSKARWKLR